MNAALQKLLNRLNNRISLMVGRAVIHAATDENGRMVVKLTALENETHDGSELFQQYGHASHPLAGSEGIIVSVMGERAHNVVIATEDKRHRPKDLKEGESVMHDHQNQYVRIFNDRIEISTSKKVVVKCDDIHLGGTDGKPIARVGDKVMINSGSSAGLTGVIHEGSAKVRAE